MTASNDIIQADSLKFMKTLPSQSFDAIITDPSYDLTDHQKFQFHSEFERLCSGVIIVFCKPENQWKDESDQYLFWVKPISTKNYNRSYPRFVEMIQIFGEHAWNTDRHWSQYNNVFTDVINNPVHPHRKPYTLMERLVLNHTNQADEILDPFAGSGPVHEACMIHFRNSVSVEIEPKYVEYIRSLD